LLRYGVPVQTAAGQAHQAVQLIDWAKRQANDFALAEEATLKAGCQRRPDIVLYLNGLATAVVELKRSSVGARPRGDAGALRHHQEPAGLLMQETIELGDVVIALTRKAVKQCAPDRTPAERAGDAGGSGAVATPASAKFV